MRSTILLSCLLSSVICYGQSDSLMVPFVSYWANGDAYDFRVTKVKQKWKEGELTKNDSSSYLVNFQVIDSTETNYRIKWSYRTNFSQYDIPDELVDRLAKYQVTEVIYQTSEVGEFLGIENWQEISDMIKGLFTSMIDLLSVNDNGKKLNLDKAMKPLMQVYESKEGIEQLVFTELHFFHFPFGVEFNANETVEYEEQLPNMFGGKPIRGDAKIYFEEVDVENSHCIMIQEMNLNPEDTKDLIHTMFKRMGLKDKDMKKAMKSAKYETSDHNRYEYYYYPGIPVKIETKRETLIDMGKGNGKRVDKTIIELLE